MLIANQNNNEACQFDSVHVDFEMMEEYLC